MQMFSLQGVRSDNNVAEVLGVFESGHDTGQRMAEFIAKLPEGMYHTITSTEHRLHRCAPVGVPMMMEKLAPDSVQVCAVLTDPRILPYAEEVIGGILASAPEAILQKIWEITCRMRETH